MKRRVTKLSQLSKKIDAYMALFGDADIVSIDIYYIEELTNLIFDNQNSKIKTFDLTKTI